MAKIVMIVPTQEMYGMAVSLASRLGVEVDIYHESSQTVLDRVAEKQQEGALVAIARGNHAALILKNMDISLIEIRLSGQSLARLIAQAKALSGKEHPTIGFLGFPNMFTDTQVFGPMLGADIRNYFVENSGQIVHAVHQAKGDGVDVLVGGEIALNFAQEVGLPGIFLQSGEDDLEAALRSAKRVLRAIEMEKKNTAEVSTLLNYSFDGIFRINLDGIITVANYMAERIFHRRADEMVGVHVSGIFDAQDSDAILSVLREGRKKYAMVLHKGNISLVANMAAISVDGENVGGILSFQEFRTIEELEEGIRLDRSRKGYNAKARFENLAFESQSMRNIQRQAEQYAKFDLPVLLLGEMGTGKRMLAECIHNASMRRKNPFVVFDCASIPESLQTSLLIGEGDKDALKIAQTGTLYIDHIERLEPYCQYQLLCGLRDSIIWQQSHTRALPVNVRIIASANKDLYPLVLEGKFSEPLYCLLCQLELELPALRERPEDISHIVDQFLEEYCALYRKYIILTEDARALIASMPWPGNALQLRLFLEKIVLLSETKIVDAQVVERLKPHTFRMAENAGTVEPPKPEPVIVYGDKDAKRILKLLEDFGGNRARVAEAMGISKSTLWRRMKKMGIEHAFKI